MLVAMTSDGIDGTTASGSPVVFGFGADALAGDVPEVLRLARQADDDGLDLFSLPDHPYLAERLDAYACLGFVLGATRRLGGLVNVTNLPLRPAPMLARAVTSLSALSGGRVVLGPAPAGAGTGSPTWACRRCPRARPSTPSRRPSS